MEVVESLCDLAPNAFKNRIFALRESVNHHQTSFLILKWGMILNQKLYVESCSYNLIDFTFINNIRAGFILIIFHRFKFLAKLDNDFVDELVNSRYKLFNWVDIVNKHYSQKLKEFFDEHKPWMYLFFITITIIWAFPYSF
jgi:hypothetical protein